MSDSPNPRCRDPSHGSMSFIGLLSTALVPLGFNGAGMGLIIEQRRFAVARVGVGDLVARRGVSASHLVRLARVVHVELVGGLLFRHLASGRAPLQLEASTLLVGHGRKFTSQVLGHGCHSVTVASSSALSRPRSWFKRVRGSPPKKSATARPALPVGGL